jgi:Sulfatase-modifying factor enzyme 1
MLEIPLKITNLSSHWIGQILETENDRLLRLLVRCLQEKAMGAPDAKVELAAIAKMHADTLVGMRTLKRLFGMEKPPAGYFPFLGTRDILCDYAGYYDWAEFVRAHTPKPETQEAPTPPTPEPPTAQQGLGSLPVDIRYPNEPFKNLDWFHREDARIFFGRGKAIQEVIAYISSIHADQVILVYGQSGVGKSSFLHAGLMPRLESQFAIWYFRREKDLTLPMLLDAMMPDLASLSSRPAIIIFDQVEAIYAQTLEVGADELHAFTMAMRAAIQAFPNLRVILSFRKEYFADIDAHLSLQGFGYKRYFLQPLNSGEIEEAVTGITRDLGAMEKYQLAIDPLVPEKILNLFAGDRQSHIAPILQIVLTKLWEAATIHGMWPPRFSDALLESNIKVKTHFLGDFVDEKIALAETIQPDWAYTGLVLDLLTYFVSEIGTATERSLDQIVSHYNHIPNIQVLVENLRESRLLSEPLESSRGSLRLAHDAIAPLVLLRFNQSSALGQKARRLLESRREAYATNSTEQESSILDSLALETILAGKSGMRTWTSAEQGLIERSRQAQLRRLRAARRNRVVALLSSLALILFGVFAVRTYMNITSNANAERSLSLIREARLIIQDPRGDLAAAAANYMEIFELGLHRDTVIADLSELVADFPLFHRPREIQPFWELIDRLPNQDSSKREICAELAYFFALGRHYRRAMDAIDLAQLAAQDRYISAAGADSCAFIRQAIIALCDSVMLNRLDEKYLPKPILVPAPDSSQSYPKEVTELIHAPFFIAETELTNFQFLAWANAFDSTEVFKKDHTDEPSNRTASIYEFGHWQIKDVAARNQPAILESAIASVYCNYFGWRLPREVEWEYAARGGPAQDTFKYAGSDEINDVACYNTLISRAQLCDARSKAPNRLGIYDMTGSLKEWLFETFVVAEVNVIDRLAKGGSFRDTPLVPTLQIGQAPGRFGLDRPIDIGFRPICAPIQCR